MSHHDAQPKADAPPAETQGGGTPRDKEVWRRLEEVLQREHHSFRHVLEQFPAYVRRIHIGRFLAHYELFKQVIDLPGVIVELGVFRGASFLTWSKLLETFCPGDRKRKVFGFDSFEGLTDFTQEDGALREASAKAVGGFSAGAVRSEVEELTSIANLDNLISGDERCKLVVGNVDETLPHFLEENPGLRISLLHLDLDLYKPTKLGLELLYPRVVKGGLVVFDEYGLMPWEGESRAVEEYFGASLPTIRKFPFSTQPHGYFVK